LYIDNLNLSLSTSGNLFEGARAWYYFVVGCTGAIFSLPEKVPNSYVTLSYSNWYALASAIPDYNINSTCLRGIKAHFDMKSTSSKTRLPGAKEFITSEYPSSSEPVPESEQSLPQPRTVVCKRARSADVESGAGKKRSRRTPGIVSETAAAQRGATLLKEAIISAYGSAAFDEEEEEEFPLNMPPADLRTTGPSVTGMEESL